MTSQKKTYGFDTKAVHSGTQLDPTTNAIITPIYATSAYAHEEPGVHKGFHYSRFSNPTRTAFEKAVADLENGVAAFACASGMAGISLILELLEKDSHIVAVDDIYGITYSLFERVKKQSSGLEVSYVDLGNTDNLLAALRSNTRMIWIETPTNPLLKLVDLKAVVAIAKLHNILVVVDNTFASPWIQKPLDDGVDIVVHSATKYLNGHSDVVGGVVVTAQEKLAERLGYMHGVIGGIAAPFDSFLMHRGIKTLGLRMERHCKNALALAAWMEGLPDIERVYYPGLPSHTQHALAQRQMKNGYGGVMSVVVKGGKERAKNFLQSLEIFTLAVSLGGVESLASHPATMTHASIPVDVRHKIGIVDGLVRISVGIEDVTDLRNDLEQALLRG